MKPRTLLVIIVHFAIGVEITYVQAILIQNAINQPKDHGQQTIAYFARLAQFQSLLKMLRTLETESTIRWVSVYS